MNTLVNESIKHKALQKNTIIAYSAYTYSQTFSGCSVLSQQISFVERPSGGGESDISSDSCQSQCECRDHQSPRQYSPLCVELLHESTEPRAFYLSYCATTWALRWGESDKE
jgi:hypothetical protein